MTTFRLAPMSAGLRVLTYVLFLLPVGFAVAASSAPAPASGVLGGTTVFVVAIYASVWLVWRPTRFELDAGALRIVWPVRRREIARARVVRARIVDVNQLVRDYGRGMRIGAGGLWGGFGLLKTRSVTFSMWISRTDRFVIVELDDARPLLVTPEDPERFVRELGST